MINRILNYLNLRKAGGIELFFASLLILSAYSFNGITLQVLWLLLFVLLLSKKQSTEKFLPLTLLCVYVLVHDFIYLFIADGNFNGYIFQIIFFGCTYFALQVFDIEKLKGSINLLAIISMIGLLYQWGIIAAGGEVRPLKLPFLELPPNRLETDLRPSSFFMEPAAYVAFMYVPLAFSLIDKKYIWTIIIILSEFLTSSTTGLLTSFIILIVYIFSQKISLKMRLITITACVLMLFALTHIEAFQIGIEKLENTDVENNIRLAQGPYVVSTMKPIEMIAGAPYSSAYAYCKSGRAPYVAFYEEEVYMSTFWMIILKYGFIGLCLYIGFYLKIIQKNRETLPLVICLLSVMFSASYAVGMLFTYTTIPLLFMANSKPNYILESS